MIVGRRQSGISTLVAELLRAGATYYSDRYAVFDSDGRIHPFARPLWLDAAGGVHPVGYRAEELRAKVGTEPLPIGVVVVTQYLPKSRARLAPITASAAAGELMTNMTCAKTYPEECLAGIRKALSNAWILKGIRGEAGKLCQS